MPTERSYSVMLVENDRKIGAFLAEELERYGYAVVTVQDFARIKEEFLAAGHQPPAL